MSQQNIDMQPQPRPGWVQRLNQMGRSVGSPKALISLDEKSLLDAAKEATGLEDFGPDEWREPFTILVHDLEQEAQLTLTGRIMARFDVVKSLIVRLQMAETERLQPEILEQPVTAPVLVTGLGRTGTSILQELLSLDPEFRSTLGWELRYPEPPPEAATRATDPRIEMAAAEIDFWVDVVPEFLAVHETTSVGADEITAGLTHEFSHPRWSAVHHVPNYSVWLAHSDANARNTRFQKRLLQHLQWKSPGRWLIKNPGQMAALPEFFTTFPDARVIITHRDPLKVLASAADMNAILRWQRSDTVDIRQFVQSIGKGFPLMLDRVMKQRQSGEVPEKQFVDIRFVDLMQDSVGTIESLYEQLGMKLSANVADHIRSYLASRPRNRHGKREYSFEHLGFNEAELREKLAGYMDHYSIPQEAL